MFTANDESDVQGKTYITISGQDVSTQELSNVNQISLFPNPVHGRSLTIEQNGDAILGIAIYNINSQLLLNRKMYEKLSQIDVTDLAPGIYFIKVSTMESLITQKFIRK
jgi:hypothetical protein